MIQIDRFFDIETQAWDRFVLGGVIDADTRRYQEFDDERDLFAELVEVGGEVWSWNGGLYDMLWFAEMARAAGLRFTAATAGTRITRLECEGLVLRDAVALIPMPLAKAAKLAGIELTKETGLPCRCGERCGGYCSIRRGMPRAQLAALGRYLRLDCEAGLAALLAVEKEAAACGYKLTGTVGGSSYASAAEIVGLDKAEWDGAREYTRARAAYFGGRTEVFRPRADAGEAYDINSAYPAALVRVDLPHGPRMSVAGDKARRAYARGKEGIYVARVEVPRDLYIPPLPHRTPAGRVCFPVGALAGVWTGLELRHAESLGVAVAIDGGIVWADAEPVLRPFMAHGWEARDRARAEGRDAMAAWHKWFLNSCTGKLAEAPEKERLVCNPRDDEPIACSCEGACSGRCGAWSPVDLDGHLWSAPFYRISNCAHVHFAAYLTAATRIQLGDMLRDDGRGGRSAIYCDTDSCYATEPRARGVGDKLGEWKHEGSFAEFHAIAPKAYRYRDAETGAWKVRAKGLSGITDDDFARFAAGESVARDRGVMGLRSAARAGGSLFRRKKIERSNLQDGQLFGARRLGSDGLTYPLTLGELAKLEKERATWRSEIQRRRRRSDTSSKRASTSACERAPF